MDEIVWAVNPRHDTLDSLVNYLGKFAQDFLSTAGIRCRLDAPVELPAIPVSAEIRHNLFLAFKEALNNVVRHSRASEVRIGFAPTTESLCVTLADNGGGVSAQPPGDPLRPTGGNGLLNMRRRMEEVGGSFEFGPGSSGGAQLLLEVPLRGRRPTSP
jgi:signal transduction histidine kinase